MTTVFFSQLNGFLLGVGTLQLAEFYGKVADLTVALGDKKVSKSARSDLARMELTQTPTHSVRDNWQSRAREQAPKAPIREGT